MLQKLRLNRNKLSVLSQLDSHTLQLAQYFIHGGKKNEVPYIGKGVGQESELAFC